MFILASIGKASNAPQAFFPTVPQKPALLFMEKKSKQRFALHFALRAS
jgi:hypothetical protein